MRQLPISFRFAFLLSVCLAVTSSLTFGWLDGRWVSQPDMAATGNKLQELPDQLGDWRLVETQSLDANAARMLRCYGHTVRIYTNAQSGNRLTVAVLFGPRGPIAVHTPEICYSGQGVQQQGERERVEVSSGGLTHGLWKTNFLSKVDLQPELEVYYAWSDGGPWQAADQPRYWLTDRLYKIQLAGPPTTEGQPSESLQFLELFLEQLQPQLVPATSDSNLSSR